MCTLHNMFIFVVILVFLLRQLIMQIGNFHIPLDFRCICPQVLTATKHPPFPLKGVLSAQILVCH